MAGRDMNCLMYIILALDRAHFDPPVNFPPVPKEGSLYFPVTGGRCVASTWLYALW